MSKTKGITGKAKHEREAAKLLGISVAEVRSRIAQGRRAAEDEEQAQKAKNRDGLIRLAVKAVDDRLMAIESMSNALFLEQHGNIPAWDLALAIKAVSSQSLEWLDDLRGYLDIAKGGDHART